MSHLHSIFDAALPMLRSWTCRSWGCWTWRSNCGIPSGPTVSGPTVSAFWCKYESCVCVSTYAKSHNVYYDYTNCIYIYMLYTSWNEMPLSSASPESSSPCLYVPTGPFVSWDFSLSPSIHRGAIFGFPLCQGWPVFNEWIGKIFQSPPFWVNDSDGKKPGQTRFFRCNSSSPTLATQKSWDGYFATVFQCKATTFCGRSQVWTSRWRSGRMTSAEVCTPSWTISMPVLPSSGNRRSGAAVVPAELWWSCLIVTDTVERL